MIGSAGIAAFIAQAAFWVLLAWGLMTGALGRRAAVAFVCLWVAGRIGLPAVGGALFLTSYVAVLDVALVLAIFKGDVRLT